MSFETSIQPILNSEIIPNLLGKDLLILSSVSKDFNLIANDEVIWKAKVTKEFLPSDFFHKPKDISWKKYYMMLYNSPRIKVWCNGNDTMPLTCLSREYLKNRFSTHPWEHCFIFNGKGIVDIFTPESPEKWTIQASFIVFITSEIQTNIRIYLNEAKRPRPNRVQQGRLATTFSSNQLWNHLINNDYIIASDNNNHEENWREARDDHKLSRTTLCRLACVLKENKTMFENTN